MAEPDFKHAFRVPSKESHGTNTIRGYLPASYAADWSGQCAELQPDSIPEFSKELSTALNWKSLPKCQTIFFTRSFLFALVLAGYKTAEGETDVTIACIKTATARTSKGNAVQFHSIDELIAHFDVDVRSRSNGSAYGYAHELAVTTPVIVGHGSCYIPYFKLVTEGLYKLYPVLGEVNRGHRPRLNRTVEDLQRYWFAGEWRLTKQKLQLTAKLVVAFVDPLTGWKASASDEVLRHLLAYLTGFRKRSLSDRALHDWVSYYSAPYFTPVINLTEEFEDAATTSVPDVTQYQQLVTLFSKIHLPFGASAAVAMNDYALQIEKREWNVWSRQARDDYKASRPERPYRVEKIQRVSTSSVRQPRGAMPRPERSSQAQRQVRAPRDSTRQPRTGPARSGRPSRVENELGQSAGSNRRPHTGRGRYPR